MERQDDLEKQFPADVKEIRYGNIIIKINRSHPERGMIIMNREQPHFHYHIYIKDGKPQFHITLEPTKNSRSKHMPIEITKMLKEVGDLLEKTFAKAKKMKLNDPRFVGKKVVFTSQHRMFIDEIVNPKKVKIIHEYLEEETIFEKIDPFKNIFGVLIDDDGTEKYIIFTNNGDVYQINVDEIDSQESWFGSILNPEDIQALESKENETIL